MKLWLEGNDTQVPLPSSFLILIRILECMVHSDYFLIHAYIILLMGTQIICVCAKNFRMLY